MPFVSHRRVLVGALAIALVPAGAALAGGSTKVAMDEFTLKAAPKAVTAGKVTFSVKNSGSDRHELVVLKTSTAASKLTVRGGRVSEKGRVGAARSIAAGTSRSLSLSLKKGHYVLVCNLPGHYAGGMRADFTVR